ncbi:hydrogenase maturation protease [Nonomuraea maritima]|uniref:Hydrogenase maturation protease n=1 Tax=Nonomuraea maritima TaxID=683260 RepID=A0A1G9ANK9_9ACTN|nr:hypothetical protein [Nonomuraea maritima]SDK28966.1 hydrogenase maturation protease [Nonomuraea maritima]
MDHVRQIAQAVLYEGYLLWPYRESSLKNQHRWTIGGVHPEAYGSAHDNHPWRMRTECLVEAEPGDTVDVCVRFLHAVTRDVVRVRDGAEERVAELVAGGERRLPGQEAQERETHASGLVLDDLCRAPAVTDIAFPAGESREPVGERAGAVLHRWQALRGRIETGARRLEPGLFLLTVEVVNTTPWPGGTRDDAVQRTLVSAHTVLHAPHARFVSLMDPPDALRAYAAECDNVGAWPVLVGEEGDRHTVLSAPIILYDHPRISPESPGDLFDATEIDQLLTLSVLALSDRERADARDGDPRAREILDRCTALSADELMRLHGIMRKEPQG